MKNHRFNLEKPIKTVAKWSGGLDYFTKADIQGGQVATFCGCLE
jgi:hypothetical protein